MFYKVGKGFSKVARNKGKKSFLLVLPLFLFVFITFIVPIFDIVFRSFYDPIVSEILPNVSREIYKWNSDTDVLPPELVFKATFNDIIVATISRNLGKAANRLNYEKSGMISMFKKTSRILKKYHKEGTNIKSYSALLMGIDKRWSDRDNWLLIKQMSKKWTISHYASAFDLKLNFDGSVEFLPYKKRIYLKLFARTIFVSIIITFFTLVLGYPIAFLLSSLPSKYNNWLIMLVLLPFWTSLLVRATSWITILQSEGVINDVFVWLGLIKDESRLQLIHNMTGTIIVMVHILLPFMVLPLYSVMKSISFTYVLAARSLGASAFEAFRYIYLPQTLSGIFAGSILVFILAIGYYITPALVGGSSGQFIGNYIFYHMQYSLNWGLAAALSVVLFTITLVLFWFYNKIIAIEKLYFN